MLSKYTSKTLHNIALAVPNLSRIEREELFRDMFGGLLGVESTDGLIGDGFCEKPASTNHHGNYEGGLLQHSVAVAYYLTLYTEKLELIWSREDSPLIIGLLHDLCKIDSYQKDEFAGAWVYSHSSLIDGHSQKSVIYAQMYGIELTKEEVLCIVNHMGPYEKDRWDSYDAAIRKNRNVMYTHMADVAASKILGV